MKNFIKKRSLSIILILLALPSMMCSINKPNSLPPGATSTAPAAITTQPPTPTITPTLPPTFTPTPTPVWGRLPNPRTSLQTDSGLYRLILNSTAIQDLAFQDGLLWAASGGSLIAWNLENGESVRYTALDLGGGEYYTDLVASPDHTLWMSYFDHLVQFVPSTLEIRRVQLPEGFANGQVLAIGTDGRVYTFLINQDTYDMPSLARYDPVKQQWEQKVIPDGPFYASSNVAIAPDGRLWFLDNDGLDKIIRLYDPRKQTFEAVEGGPRGALNTLAISADSNVWVGTKIFCFEGCGIENGVGVYDPDNKKWQNIKPTDWPAKLEIFSSVAASDGSVWFGTERGVSRYHPTDKSWKHFTQQEGLNGQTVHSAVVGPDGALWFGTDMGVSRYDLTNSQWSSLNLPEADTHLFGNPTVLQVAPDQTIWLSITYAPRVLHRFDPSSGSWASYSQSDGLLSNLVTDLVMENSGAIWISSRMNYFGGIKFSRFDPIKKSWEVLDKEGVSDEYGRDVLIAADSNNTIWFVKSEESSVLRYSSDGNWSPVALKTAIRQGMILSIAITKDDSVWFLVSPEKQKMGSPVSGKNLYRYFPSTEKWEAFSLADHLPVGSASYITAAPDGSLWLATDKGFALYAPDSVKWELYPAAGPLQALLGRSYSWWADATRFAVDGNGIAWFGMGGSVYQFIPTSAEQSQHIITPLPTLAPPPTSAFTPTPVFSCPNAPRTRLKVGQQGRVTFTDGSTTRVRSSPEISQNIIANIPEGTVFKVIGGPVCVPRPGRSDAFVLWQIQVLSNDLVGWVAEGDMNDYYLEPYNR